MSDYPSQNGMIHNAGTYEKFGVAQLDQNVAAQPSAG